MAQFDNPLDALQGNDIDGPDELPATCPWHGPYMKRRRATHFWMGCPNCYEERERQREEERQKDERERAQALRRGRLNRSGLLGGRFEGATFDSFAVTSEEQRKVLDACKAYAEAVQADSGAGLILIGPPGTGKSHLMAAIVRHVIEQGKCGATVVTSRELLRRLRATWHRDAKETETQVIDALSVDMGLLALDEVGASFGTEAEQVQLLDLVDARYKLRRPTLVASNLSVPGLRDAVGERCFDRLREGATVLPCDWASHRGTRS